MAYRQTCLVSLLVAERLELAEGRPTPYLSFSFNVQRWTHDAKEKRCTWMQREKGGQKDEYQSARTHKD
jgi:hypothetical protein